MTKTEKGYVVVKTAEALARLAGVASALGDSSRYLWLKLPYCEGYETVARATTLPILLLGGESAGDPVAVPAATRDRRWPRDRMCAARWWAETSCIPARKIRWPWRRRPAASCTKAGPSSTRLQSMAANRGRDMDRLSRWL